MMLVTFTAGGVQHWGTTAPGASSPSPTPSRNCERSAA